MSENQGIRIRQTKKSVEPLIRPMEPVWGLETYGYCRTRTTQRRTTLKEPGKRSQRPSIAGDAYGDGPLVSWAGLPRGRKPSKPWFPPTMDVTQGLLESCVPSTLTAVPRTATRPVGPRPVSANDACVELSPPKRSSPGIRGLRDVAGFRKRPFPGPVKGKPFFCQGERPGRSVAVN